MKDYSIEYSHIYVSQSFGDEQLKSAQLMKKREKQLKENGLTVTRQILIDDYSTATGLERFDKTSFESSLKKCGATPDNIVLESSFTNVCEEIASQIQDKSLRKSINHYFKTRNKWPCSMCVAAWYLIRLGKFKHNGSNLVCEKIISILPDRFRSPEQEAREIIESAGYVDTLDKIEIDFFESSYKDYSDWTKFDAKEYADRNYLHKVLPEDKKILGFVVDYLDKNCKPSSLGLVADVGAGPNIYPALAVRPFLSNDGELELIDPVENNRNFLMQVVKSTNAWNEFEKLLHNKKPELYNMPAKLPQKTVINEGDIFNLKQNQYDLVLSFFVAESITDDYKFVQKAMNSLKSAVKPGGILITAHMLGSVGYFAGMLTNFPATPINKQDLENFYANFTNVEMLTTSHNTKYDPRKGYKGMAVVGGIKPLA